MPKNVKLSLFKKEPYYKFFIDQVKIANESFIHDFISQQSNSDLALNPYFNLVQ
jgi:hypothetical protein